MTEAEEKVEKGDRKAWNEGEDWILDRVAREGLNGKMIIIRIFNDNDNGRHVFHVPDFTRNDFSILYSIWHLLFKYK